MSVMSSGDTNGWGVGGRWTKWLVCWQPVNKVMTTQWPRFWMRASTSTSKMRQAWRPSRLAVNQTGCQSNWLSVKLAVNQTGCQSNWLPLKLTVNQTGCQSNWPSIKLAASLPIKPAVNQTSYQSNQLSIKLAAACLSNWLSVKPLHCQLGEVIGVSSFQFFLQCAAVQ